MEYQEMKSHGVKITSDPYFTLQADSDGTGFVQCGDGVLVVPLTDDDEVLIAVERSPAFNQNVLTLVGGAIEPGERQEQVANRELQEELGWRAEQIDYLGEIFPFKYLLSRQFIFLARQLKPSKLVGDEKYPVEVRAVPLDEALLRATTGELRDACAIAALALAQLYLRGEQR